LTESSVIFVNKNTVGMNHLQIMPYHRQTVVTSTGTSPNTLNKCSLIQVSF